MSFASTIENAVDKYFSKNQKYFKSKKGENFELKNDLNSEYKSIRKDAVKRVIANMTLGKNVSELFADVLKCMQTDDLELKKLVYLYLMNYAKTQPELVILAVNTFVKDAEDLNPLIRALAIRTMGCLRAEKIVDYLFEPLRKGLVDQDPYVRKTAAICVAKMYTLAPDRTIEYGFLEQVESLLQDENPMVIANAIASLHELRGHTGKSNINSQSLNKLLNSLNDCTEWGQIVIMESLCEYHTISDPEEAMIIADKTSARLQHQNPSVVITAIRLIFICLQITNAEFTDPMLKKLKGPIISLLNTTQSELLFSFLRNMHIIVQKYPNLLNGDLRPFYCKYNDPPYVKLEKLALLSKLANQDSIDAILSELKEYASEVDIEFCSASIHAFQVIALRFPSTAEKCVNCLLELLKTKIDYICNDATISLQQIIRKYPGLFDKSVEYIAPLLPIVNDTGKEAIIYLIGEYPSHVVGIYDVLELLVNGFNDELPSIQLNILITVVKCFLKRPNDANIQARLQATLQLATESNNPDLRDRAFIYWRLLSTNPEQTRVIVWHKKEIINESTLEHKIDAQFVDECLKELSTLSALFHVNKQLLVNDVNANTTSSHAINAIVEEEEGNLLDLGDITTNTAAVGGNVQELLDTFGPGPVAQSILSPSASPVQLQQQLKELQLHDANTALLLKTDHLEIEYKYHTSAKDHAVYLMLQFNNISNLVLNEFAIQFNKNSLALVPAALLNINELQPKQKMMVDLPLTHHMESMYQQTMPFDLVQIAIKYNMGVYFGNSTVGLLEMAFEPASSKVELIIAEMQQQQSQLQHVQFDVAIHKTLQQLQQQLPKSVVFANVFYID